MNRLDELLNESFKRDLAEREEREARKAAMKDPFKKPRTEPGRARPGHGQHGKARRAYGSVGHQRGELL
jgi:hypothetical protein